MDRLQQLTHYLNKMISDHRLKSVHLSLSVALCHAWIASQFQHPYHASRRLLMRASRIRSKATYHKAMRDLEIFGYVEYNPSYHPAKGSAIKILVDNVLPEANNES